MGILGVPTVPVVPATIVATPVLITLVPATVNFAAPADGPTLLELTIMDRLARVFIFVPVIGNPPDVGSVLTATVRTCDDPLLPGSWKFGPRTRICGCDWAVIGLIHLAPPALPPPPLCTCTH
jgi:hypothetical protein